MFTSVDGCQWERRGYIDKQSPSILPGSTASRCTDSPASIAVAESVTLVSGDHLGAAAYGGPGP